MIQPQHCFSVPSCLALFPPAENVAAEAETRMQPLKQERKRLLNDLIAAKGMALAPAAGVESADHGVSVSYCVDYIPRRLKSAGERESAP